MAWLIGIDEAGYGPNLGPLVMSGVACRVPDTLIGANLWATLAPVVRRQADPDEGQLVIDDSKEVYDSGRGLTGLELGVLGTMLPWPRDPFTLAEYLRTFAPSALSPLGEECWFDGPREVSLPMEATHTALTQHHQRWSNACQSATVEWRTPCSVILCARRFNAIVEEAGSKGAALAWGLAQIVNAIIPTLPDDDAIYVAVDKHGGRNTYAAMLQDALTDGVVMVQQEGALRSVYRIVGAARPIQFTFQPRADSEHFVVALASMVSKYLRELLMIEFNRHWTAQVAGLKPTAGYPSDAGRFLEAIRPLIEAKGIPMDDIWRRR